MIMPFHGDDPLFTRAYTTSTTQRITLSLSHRILYTGTRPHTLKETCTYIVTPSALLRHGVNECATRYTRSVCPFDWQGTLAGIAGAADKSHPTNVAGNNEFSE